MDARTVELSSRHYADVAVAAPRGRIDHAAAGAFELALAPLVEAACSTRGALLLDFADIQYISSVGLRVLMIAAKRTRAHGARIGVAGLQPMVAEIFAISRFDTVLEVFPSLRDGLGRMSAQALAELDATAPPPP